METIQGERYHFWLLGKEWTSIIILFGTCLFPIHGCWNISCVTSSFFSPHYIFLWILKSKWMEFIIYWLNSLICGTIMWFCSSFVRRHSFKPCLNLECLTLFFSQFLLWLVPPFPSKELLAESTTQYQPEWEINLIALVLGELNITTLN